jgi:hypothetical protein
VLGAGWVLGAGCWVLVCQGAGCRGWLARICNPCQVLPGELAPVTNRRQLRIRFNKLIIMDEPVIKINETEYPLHSSDPEIIPDSTFWPLALAFGTTLLLWGFLTSLILSGVGILCMAISLAGWIGEINNEK